MGLAERQKELNDSALLKWEAFFFLISRSRFRKMEEAERINRAKGQEPEEDPWPIERIRLPKILSLFR